MKPFPPDKKAYIVFRGRRLKIYVFYYFLENRTILKERQFNDGSLLANVC